MSGIDRTIISKAELINPRARGRYLMSYCPIHGGDHQRSLHINLENGYGQCHACGVQVFCPEIAPEGTPWPSKQKRPVTASDLLRPRRRRRDIGNEVIAEWQRRELATLHKLYPRMQARLEDSRAQTYLAGRGIPLEVARAAGVGYIPQDAKLTGPMTKWRDRLVFPLGSPAGTTGFAGRSLWHHEIVSDEEQHKLLLDSAKDAPERWRKTLPAGWFNYGALRDAERCVIVEGPLDALALMAAGLVDVPVVALVGTAAPVEWIPPSVLSAVIALDGDEGGLKATQELWRELMASGVRVQCATPPAADGLGKDWSARWRSARWDGVAPVFDALDALQASATPQPATDAQEQAGSGELPHTASPESQQTPWLDVQVIQYLLRAGFQIAEAHLLPEAVTSVSSEPLWSS